MAGYMSRTQHVKTNIFLTVRAKRTLANTILQGKVEGIRSRGRTARQWLDDVKEWITRKASKTVVGRCKGMDHEEGQQDSGWTM